MPLTRANAADVPSMDGPGLSIHEDVAVAADALWEILGDFGGLVAWNPFVAGCETFCEGGQLFRIVATADGVRICERADVVDGRRRKLVYTIVSSDPARPFVGRVATILIDRINDINARITWSVQQRGITFAPEQADALCAGFRARIKALVSAAAHLYAASTHARTPAR
jgi:hypothetical protein